MDFDGLTRKELQTLCKKNKIPANMTNVAMADALKALQHVEGIDEFLNPSSDTNPAQSPEKNTSNYPEFHGTSCRNSSRRKPVTVVEPQSSQPTICTRRTTRRTAAAQESNQENKNANLPETPAVPISQKALAVRDLSQEMEGEEDKKKDLPETPVAQSGRRRVVRASSRRKIEVQKEEGLVVSLPQGYSTRRSVRLLGKTMAGLNLKGQEKVEPVKIDELHKEIEELEHKEELSGDVLQITSEDCSEKNDDEDSEVMSGQNVDNDRGADGGKVKPEMCDEKCDNAAGLSTLAAKDDERSDEPEVPKVVERPEKAIAENEDSTGAVDVPITEFSSEFEKDANGAFTEGVFTEVTKSEDHLVLEDCGGFSVEVKGHELNNLKDVRAYLDLSAHDENPEIETSGIDEAEDDQQQLVNGGQESSVSDQEADQMKDSESFMDTENPEEDLVVDQESIKQDLNTERESHESLVDIDAIEAEDLDDDQESIDCSKDLNIERESYDAEPLVDVDVIEAEELEVAVHECQTSQDESDKSQNSGKQMLEDDEVVVGMMQEYVDSDTMVDVFVKPAAEEYDTEPLLDVDVDVIEAEKLEAAVHQCQTPLDKSDKSQISEKQMAEDDEVVVGMMQEYVDSDNVFVKPTAEEYDTEPLVDVDVIEAEELEVAVHKCQTSLDKSDKSQMSEKQMVEDDEVVGEMMQEYVNSETLVDVFVMQAEEFAMAAAKECPSSPTSSGKVTSETPVSPVATIDPLPTQFPRPTLPTPSKYSANKTVIQKIDTTAPDINKENIDTSGMKVELQKDKIKNNKNTIDGASLNDISLRQLRKMLKELRISNNIKTSEEQNVGKIRPALQTLPENCIPAAEQEKKN